MMFSQEKKEARMGSVSHVIKIQDVMKSGNVMYSYDFPKWLVELCENHKSSWIPNSKGGEPNH